MPFQADDPEVLKLLADNNEFAKLFDKHGELERQVGEINDKKYLNAEDEMELLRLKKTKLLGKDRMEKILGESKGASV